jgi:hypothetical protein
MTEREDIVSAVIAAAGGELIGRVRLQKTVYLLDRLGLDSGFPATSTMRQRTRRPSGLSKKHLLIARTMA